MSKVLEQTVEIKGEIGSSFIQAFKSASGNMADLRQEARQVQRELDRLGNDFRNGKIHQSQYADETRKLTQELNRLEQKQKTLDTFKSKLNTGWKNTKAIATIGAVGAATATTALAIKSLNVAGDFEAQMSKVAAKTEATKAEMSALTETALELGAKTSLSASETAIAMDELAAGGMNVKQIMSAMPGIIAGAEASGEDLALVSSTVSSALSIWGMEAEKASKVSDILSKSANISAASVEDFSYAFKYAGKPAADLGMSIEETAAAISLMTDAGMDGSSAGTGLRASLLNLASPTKKQSELLKRLNVSMKDSTGKAKPLAKIVGELDKAMKGMTNVDKVATLETLVGTEAVSGFMTLMSAGEDKIASYTKQLEQSAGSAAKASAVMMDNYAGAKEQMLGALESAQIAAASPSLDVLKQAFTGISAMIEDNIPEIEAAGQNVANVLEDIFAPFIAYEEPIKPVITPEMDPNDAKQAMVEYQKALEIHNLFGNMDLGDKVDYMLDQTIDHVSQWVQGEGGEKMQKLFGELAKIAASAWSSSFTTLAKGAVSELAEGDIGSAVAMGAAANAMTGGLLMTGGMAGGKYLLGKGKGVMTKGKSSVSAAVPKVNASTSSKAEVNPTSKASQTSKSTSRVASTVKPGSKVLGSVGKVAGKATLPLSIATGMIGVAKSDDKVKAVGSLGGSLAGGLGGAKVGGVAGAAIGSIVPGLGTAIGGAIGTALGGIAGTLAGSGIGSKLVGLFKSNSVKAEPAPIKPKTSTVTPTISNQNSAPINQSATTLSTNVTTLTTTTTTFTSSLNNVVTTTNLLNTNLNLLATNTSNAATGMAAFLNIQTAANRVINALGNLEQRINNTSVPGSSSGGGRLAYE